MGQKKLSDSEIKPQEPGNEKAFYIGWVVGVIISKLFWIFPSKEEKQEKEDNEL